MSACKTAVVSCGVLLISVAVGCGGTSSTGSPDGGAVDAGPSCTDLASSARDEVASVISAHLMCTTATDCVATSLSASCFDSCSRVVRASDVAAVKAAKDKVDAAQCSDFRAKGCKFVAPPCDPGSPPACTNGACR